VAAEDGESLDIRSEVLGLIRAEIEDVVSFNFGSRENQEEAVHEILQTTNTILPVTEKVVADAKLAGENAADREFGYVDVLTKAAEEYFAHKENEIGKELFEQITRFVALQSLDNLWMEHLDTMDHLRDSVRLRGYGQRDPLVEYKREGFELFARLTKEIDGQIARSVLRVNIAPQTAQDQGTSDRGQVTGTTSQNWVTNRSDVPVGAGTPPTGDGSHIGRNDACPCGSGKKYKKCGLLNTPEHQSNMAKGGAKHQQRIGG
jgi:preprotein translocase subunit SecA